MQTITPSEWRLMRVIWTLKSATSTQIIQQLQAITDWSNSTIKTLLKRLENKDFVAHTGESRNRKYHATVKETELMKTQLLTLVNAMCAHKTGAVFAEIINEIPLSQGDCQKLMSQLAIKETTAPETVDCNCLAKTCRCGN